jgi:hypothetical protein
LNRKHKRYEPNTALVCLLSPNVIENYPFQKWSMELRDIEFPLEHVFCVFHGCKQFSLSQEKSEDNMIKLLSQIVLIQLLPKCSEVVVSPTEFCDKFFKGKDGAWLKFEGRGRKGGFRDITINQAPSLFD